jgi:hypothetical protein
MGKHTSDYYNCEGRFSDHHGEVRHFDEDEICENSPEGFFCEGCVEAIEAKWWSKESSAYIYDNCGNHPDDPEYDPENN